MSKNREIVVFSQLKQPEIAPPGYIPEYAPERNLAVARVIANLTGNALNETGIVNPGAFVIPDRPLLRNEADPLGIQQEDDLFGGVVAVKLHHDKAILHPVVNQDAYLPKEYSAMFSEGVSGAVLPGYTAFSPIDALLAYRRMRAEGLEVRCKDPAGEGGNGQETIDTLQQMETLVSRIPGAKLALEGLVLEHNIINPTTLSIGQIYLAGKYFSYYGEQQSTLLDGESTYGGTTLTMSRGSLAEVAAGLDDGLIKTAIDQACMVGEAYSHYGPTISRLNFDVVQGRDVHDEFHSGVVDQSLRIGGASPAEVIAIRELEADPTLKDVTTRVAIDWTPSKTPLHPDDIVFFDHAIRRDTVSIL